MKRIIIPFVLVMVLLLSGCSGTQEAIKRLEDVRDKSLTVGLEEDMDQKECVFSICPNATVVSQNDFLYGIRSVSEGQLDAYIAGRIYLEETIREAGIKNVSILDEPIVSYPCALGLSKSCTIPGYQQTVNATLSRMMADGTIDEMSERWLKQGNEEMPEIVLDENPAYFLNAATFGLSKPLSYMKDGVLTGFDVELLYRVCAENHWGLKLDHADYRGLLMGLATGKYDMVSANLFVTENREENVEFSVSFRSEDICMAVRKDDGVVETGDAGKQEYNTFTDTIRKGLERTFVTEERWRIVVSGLGITLLITMGGFVLANILGGVFCACNLSRKKGLRILADIYNRIMQGTPMVVILMILYYVIFGKSHLSGVWVAIMAFGLNSGANLAQQFSGAIIGVDKGQAEAALAMGFTKYQAFKGIVFPQAARTALNGYFSELITLMKGTAIVGYIAVIDLTKASDLIRSSTFDAFFPLLSVALIYFLIAFGLLSLLKYIQKKLAPKRVSPKEAVK